jgi:opacity protein-like surface antigen
MKSFVLNILTIIILLPSFAQSQLIKSGGFKVGGISASQSFDYSLDFSLPIDNRWGWNIGGFVEFFQHPNLSLLTELHYIQKGYSLSLPVTTADQPEGTGAYITFKPRLDYVSLPILVRLRFETGSVTPYVLVGPRFDFMMSQIDNAITYSGTDKGMTFGGGVQFPVSPSSQLLVEGRFSPSFGNAFQNPNLTVKNKSFEMFVGMSF